MLLLVRRIRAIGLAVAGPAERDALPVPAFKLVGGAHFPCKYQETQSDLMMILVRLMA